MLQTVCFRNMLPRNSSYSKATPMFAGKNKIFKILKENCCNQQFHKGHLKLKYQNKFS